MMRGSPIVVARLGPSPALEGAKCRPTDLCRTVGGGSSGHADGRQGRLARQSLVAKLSTMAIGVDFLMVVSGFLCAYWLRFSSGLIPRYTEQEGPVPPSGYLASGYWKLILLGSLVVLLGLLSKDMSRLEDLLCPRRIRARLAGVVTTCLAAFLGLSLAVRTSPPLSRMFVLCAAACVPLAVYAWRALLAAALRRSLLSKYLRQRVLLVGCNAEVCRIHKSVLADARGSVEFVGCLRGRKANGNGNGACPYARGAIRDIGAALEQESVDAVVVADRTIAEREVRRVARICEQQQVAFKMVPRYFQALVSGLRPATIGDVPVLGVEALPLNRLENQLLKRAVDLAGAAVGLALSAPLIAAFGALVYWESPGPILYRQVRMGRHGRLFSMFKIRSMRPDAEENGGAQWAQKNDSRRLRIGAFMRKWNIDELPQFWNVLRGDMSLVGPRPERPELIEKFKWRVPHYSVRHSCPPGLTGWAQVNGWRGNTSLKERIRHDIWYVENWSLWLDIRILMMTLFRFDNAC